MLHEPFSSKDNLKKLFWKNIHFERRAVWCGVNRMIIHFSEASIPPSIRFFYSSFSSNHPSAISVVCPQPAATTFAFSSLSNSSSLPCLSPVTSPGAECESPASSLQYSTHLHHSPSSHNIKVQGFYVIFKYSASQFVQFVSKTVCKI